MTTKATTLLLEEHEIIMQAQKVILLMDKLWETDAASFKTYTMELLTFFREYSDKFHHYKEEEVLFPETKNHPEFVLQEIIEELEEHHTMFREYAKEIRKASESDSHAEAYRVLKKYIYELLDHIAVENDEFFSMADSLFSEQDMDKIYYRFKDIDLQLGEEEKRKLESIPGKIITALKK